MRENEGSLTDGGEQTPGERRDGAEREKTPSRLLKTVRMLALSAVLLIALLVVIGIYSAGRRTARLEAAFKQARDEGLALTEAELEAKLPRIGEDENAARVYLKAFELLPAGDLGTERRSLDAPLFGGAAPAFDPLKPLPADLVAEIQSLIEEQQEVLALLHEASRLESCRYGWPLTWSPLYRDHTEGLRKSGLLLVLAAWLGAEKGDAHAAAERLQDAWALSGSMENDPFLGSVLRSCNLRNVVLTRGLERVLSRSDPSRADLLALQSELAAAAERIDISSALEAVLVGTLPTHDQYREGDTQFLNGLHGSHTNRFVRMVRSAYYAHPDTDQTAAIEAILAMLSEADNAKKDHLRVAALAKAAAKPKESRCIIAMDLAPSLAKSVIQVERTRGRIRAAAAAIAALRYNKDHGNWPASLDELAPTYIDIVPRDPFTGKPLLYKTTERGIVVYSVGDDCLDDGGEARLDAVFRLVREPSPEVSDDGQ